jgi:hypothetical protein
MRLATVPLKQTLTPNVVLKKGEEAAKRCEKAEAELRKSEFLGEERVTFPGDTEGFAMTWLANGPLTMVKICNGNDTRRSGVSEVELMASGPVYDLSAPNLGHFDVLLRSRRGASVASTGSVENLPSTTNRRQPSRSSTRAGSQPPTTVNPAHLQTRPASDPTFVPDTVPKALVLHVVLTEKTFYDSITDGSPQHIKIDVFFNGQLSSCVLVHQNDIRSGAKSHHQIFAGKRVDFMAERPWVIYLPYSSRSATTRGYKETMSARDRWDEISQALMTEANARGTNAKRERPPSARYLVELASMQMPDVVETMQKPGGTTFGVVDVIVTVGLGKKSTSTVKYAKTPTRLVDEAYPYEIQEETNQVGANREELDAVGEQPGPTDGRCEEGREEFIIQMDGQDERDPGVHPSSGAEPSALLPTPSAPPSSGRAPPPTFSNLFTGTPIPDISPSGPYIYPGLLTRSSASIAEGTHRGPNVPPSRKRPWPEFAAAKNNDSMRPVRDGQCYDARQSDTSAHASSSSSRDTMAATHVSSGLHLNQYDDFMHSNPYQPPYANMMMGFDLSGLPELNSLDRATSSPLRDQASGQLVLPTVPSFHQQDQNQNQDTEAISGSSGPGLSPLTTPDALPSQAQRPLLGQANAASANPGALQNETPAAIGIPTQGLQSFPGTSYSSSPLAQYSFSPRGPSPYPYMAPFTIGPSPPIGSFKATQKPKTKRAMPIDPGLVDVFQARPSILVRRLRITGRNSAPVLDHKWKTPQRIVASRGQALLSNSSGSSSRPRRASLGSSDYVKSSGRSRRSRGVATTVATPPSTSPMDTAGTTKTLSGVDSLKRDSVHDNRSTRTPSHRKEVPAGSGSTGDQSETVTQHRTFRSNILGIQGPKATRVVFDDPEELIRRKRTKSASQSRSISPTKLDAPPTKHTADAKKQAGGKIASAVDSSPVSSPPSSPEVALSSLVGPSSRVVPPSSNSSKAAQLATSADSSVKQKQLQTLVDAPKSSHSRSTASMPPPSVHAPSSARQPKIIKPKFQKVETSNHRPRPGPQSRQPRSPDRVSTAQNPPLSRNCVIQLAQSGTGLDDRKGALGEGLLRQIKSERQGVFSEESVVVGVRFLVPA